MFFKLGVKMSEKDDIYLDRILEEIKDKRNFDFLQYRKKLLLRRVMVRVRSTRYPDLESYFAYLKDNHEEMDLLMDALTINVTEFFRDPLVFDALEKGLIPELFANKERSKIATVRVWSCGCSSGEEAHSLLISMAEFLGKDIKRYRLKIFGTDIDKASLTKAKKGVFSADKFEKLAEDKKRAVNRYFNVSGNGRNYSIRDEWRGYIDFRHHNIVSDPPIDKVDLILCRNMLIYFDRDLQAKVLEKLGTALVEGGFLVLGNVESLWGKARGQFVEYDRQARIYLKR